MREMQKVRFDYSLFVASKKYSWQISPINFFVIKKAH